MAIKITSVSEALEENGLKFLIHGMAGAGKTVMCATTGEATLIISAESGLLSIAGAPDYIDVTVVKTISQLEEVYDFLATGKHKYKWANLDSISEIAEVLLADEKREAKDPRQAYGNLSDRMLGIMRNFRDLPNMNVVFTCKQQRQEDPDTNTTRFVPLLPGKALTNSISYLFDEVFAIRVEKDEDGDDYYTCQTGRDRNYEAKDRSGLLDMFEAPSLKAIAAKIRAGHVEEDEDEDNASGKDETEYLESSEANKERLEESIDQVDEAKTAEEHEAEERTHNNEGDKIGGDCPTEKEIEREDDAVGDFNSGSIENGTDSPMYLYHNTSDAILKLDSGDSIDDDGNIDTIDYKTYVQHKKRLAAKK